MEKISVIGAGAMGIDIALCFSQKGYSVIVNDISDEILSKAKTKMENGLSVKVEKGKMTAEEKAAVLNCISFSTSYADLADSDVVIEAVVERMDVKKSVFGKLDGICRPDTIFASNTSSLSITEIASATKRPEKFIGMHFFNPATVMKLVEIIRGAHTSDDTFHKIQSLALQLGKTPVEVSEAPGFVVNRILIPMINEATSIYADGIASVEDIDTAMKLGANHPMGPLALGDLIGLDVCLNIMDILYAETGDCKYRAHPLLRKMVRGGLLGKKTGRGFYHYAK